MDRVHPAKLTDAQREEIHSLAKLYTREINAIETYLRASNLPANLDTEILACLGLAIVAQDNVERMMIDSTFIRKNLENLKRMQPMIHNLCAEIQREVAEFRSPDFRPPENIDATVFTMLDKTRDGSFPLSFFKAHSLQAVFTLGPESKDRSKLMYLILQKMKQMGLDIDITAIYEKQKISHNRSKQKLAQTLEQSAEATKYFDGMDDIKKDLDKLRDQLRDHDF